MMDWWFWPLAGAFFGAWFVVGILFLAFWIWMIVDCAQRKFKKDAEKIIWLIIIVLGTWVGALVYFLVVRLYNPRGLIQK